MRSLSVLVLVPLVACSGGNTDSDSANPETDLETVFCDLLSAAGEPVTAAPLDGGDGPELVREDLALDIALVDDGTGMFSGRGTYTPDETGSFAFGLSDDVPFVLLDGSSEVPFDAEIAGGCSELAVRYTATLDIQTYVIEFGPTDVDVVGLVSEESDDDL